MDGSPLERQPRWGCVEMGSYAPGWITVPGKGRRWRTSDGTYMNQRPAGSAPGVMDALKGAWGQADRALGGWLPGGGVANPASNVVRGVSQAALGGGAMKPVLDRLKPSLNDGLGFLGIGGLGAGAAAVQKGMRGSGIVGPLKPSVQTISEQMKVLKSSHGYLDGLQSGVKDYNERILGTPSKMPSSAMVDLEYGAGPMGPHFEPQNTAVKGTVRVNSGTPAWVWAHEFGHAADHIKRPGAFLTEMDEEAARRLRTRNASPGSILAFKGGASGEDRDKGLLAAGAEGALLGLASQWDMLSKEVLADVHGRKIAKSAGVPWNERQNAFAKGTYAIGAAGGGYVQGVYAEALNRAAEKAARITKDALIDPLARRIRGADSTTEAQLRQYGYNPRDYALDKDTEGAQVRRRHPLGSAVMRHDGVQ